MFEAKKTLLVVYKDELLVNQLKKMVDTNDDAGGVVGPRDGSINSVSWTEKVWRNNKDAGNIQGKILFLGDVKGSDELIPVLDVKFDDCGVKYGWAGNQAVVYCDLDALVSRESYDELLAKLNSLPVPQFLKETKADIVSPELSESDAGEDADGLMQGERRSAAFLDVAKKALETGVEVIGKAGGQVVAKSEEVFRSRPLMRRQALFYGVVMLYRNDLESFMNE